MGLPESGLDVPSTLKKLLKSPPSQVTYPSVGADVFDTSGGFESLPWHLPGRSVVIATGSGISENFTVGTMEALRHWVSTGGMLIAMGEKGFVSWLWGEGVLRPVSAGESSEISTKVQSDSSSMWYNGLPETLARPPRRAFQVVQAALSLSVLANGTSPAFDSGRSRVLGLHRVGSATSMDEAVWSIAMLQYGRGRVVAIVDEVLETLTKAEYEPWVQALTVSMTRGMYGTRT